MRSVLFHAVKDGDHGPLLPESVEEGHGSWLPASVGEDHDPSSFASVNQEDHDPSLFASVKRFVAFIIALGPAVGQALTFWAAMYVSMGYIGLASPSIPFCAVLFLLAFYPYLREEISFYYELFFPDKKTPPPPSEKNITSNNITPLIYFIAMLIALTIGVCTCIQVWSPLGGLFGGIAKALPFLHLTTTTPFAVQVTLTAISGLLNGLLFYNPTTCQKFIDKINLGTVVWSLWAGIPFGIYTAHELIATFQLAMPAAIVLAIAFVVGTVLLWDSNKDSPESPDSLDIPPEPGKDMLQKVPSAICYGFFILLCIANATANACLNTSGGITNPYLLGFFFITSLACSAYLMSTRYKYLQNFWTADSDPTTQEQRNAQKHMSLAALICAGLIAVLILGTATNILTLTTPMIIGLSLGICIPVAVAVMYRIPTPTNYEASYTERAEPLAPAALAPPVNQDPAQHHSRASGNAPYSSSGLRHRR